MLKNIVIFLTGYTLFIVVLLLLIEEKQASMGNESAAEIENILKVAIKESSNNIFMDGDYWGDSFSISPENVLSYCLNGKKGKIKLESSGVSEDMQCRLIYDCYIVSDSMYVYNLYDICARILRENNNPNSIILAIYNSDDSLIASSNSKIEPHAFINMLCTNRVSLGHYNTHYLVAYINKLPFYVGIEKMLILIVTLLILYTYAMCKLIITLYHDKSRLFVRENQISYLKHEVVKPLSGLSQRVDFMIEAEKSTELTYVKNYIDKVINASILFTCADSEINIDRRICDIQRIFLSVVNIYSSMYRNVKWSINVDEGVREQYLDYNSVSLVISNIVDNAIKFNDNAIPEISLSCVRNDNMIELKIADNGPGIEKRYLKKIFLQNFRIPTSIEKSKTGMGIGLSFVKKIVKAHGGEVWAESVFGKGTIIVAQLPIIE